MQVDRHGDAEEAWRRRSGIGVGPNMSNVGRGETAQYMNVASDMACLLSTISSIVQREKLRHHSKAMRTAAQIILCKSGVRFWCVCEPSQAWVLGIRCQASSGNLRLGNRLPQTRYG